jgi:hypothetical protein
VAQVLDELAALVVDGIPGQEAVHGGGQQTGVGGPAVGYGRMVEPVIAQAQGAALEDAQDRVRQARRAALCGLKVDLQADQVAPTQVWWSADSKRR